MALGAQNTLLGLLFSMNVKHLPSPTLALIGTAHYDHLSCRPVSAPLNPISIAQAPANPIR